MCDIGKDFQTLFSGDIVHKKGMPHIFTRWGVPNGYLIFSPSIFLIDFSSLFFPQNRQRNASCCRSRIIVLSFLNWYTQREKNLAKKFKNTYVRIKDHCFMDRNFLQNFQENSPINFSLKVCLWISLLYINNCSQKSGLTSVKHFLTKCCCNVTIIILGSQHHSCLVKALSHFWVQTWTWADSSRRAEMSWAELVSLRSSSVFPQLEDT